jgi:hypothetical protein
MSLLILLAALALIGGITAIVMAVIAAKRKD